MSTRSGYDALRESAGVFLPPDRGRIAVGGVDCREYLQGQLTNDVLALQDGTGCYSAYLTPQGRMIADMDVASVADHLLLDVHASVRESLVQRFDQLVFTEEVEVNDWSERWDGIAVSGPAAGALVASAIAALTSRGSMHPLANLPSHGCVQIAVGDGSLIAMRTDPLGSWGINLWVEKSQTARLLDALRDAGGVDVGPADRDIVRIENGRPLFPVDMDADTIPLEAGIEQRALSFTKGCYVGQEVIVRILHRGQGRIARRLSGVKCVAPVSEAFDAGTPLFHADKEVGRITSSCVSPALSTVVALGYIVRDHAEAGTALQIGSTRHAAVVTPLPFVDP